MNFYISGATELYTEESTEKIKLYFPEDIKVSAHSTKLIDMNVKVALRSYRDEVFYIHGTIDLPKTPLRTSQTVVMGKGITSVKIFFDNISANDYYIKRGDCLLETCSGGLDIVDILLVDEIPLRFTSTEPLVTPVDTPTEPLVVTPTEPLVVTPTEPLVVTPTEPLVVTPTEPLVTPVDTPAEPLVTPVVTPTEPLVDTPTEPLVDTPTEPLVTPVVTPTEPLVTQAPTSPQLVLTITPKKPRKSKKGK